MHQVPIAAAGSKVWVLNDEGNGEFAFDDGVSFCGVFTSRENALKHLADSLLGKELAATIGWVQSPNNLEYFAGVSSKGSRYILMTACVDEELRTDELTDHI